MTNAASRFTIAWFVPAYSTPLSVSARNRRSNIFLEQHLVFLLNNKERYVHMSIWNFIQNQLLGMAWLNDVIGLGLQKAGLDINSRWGGSIQFFLYDTLKITILLCVLIFIISYIQSYFPPERSKRILGRYHGIWANTLGALLGTVTPFCSCSSIPLFIGFTRAGLPLGVTFSFLISSPMVDLGSLVLLMSIFGAKVAIVYVVAGLLIAFWAKFRIIILKSVSLP